jgi:hypothetical protein
MLSAGSTRFAPMAWLRARPLLLALAAGWSSPVSASRPA